MPLPNPLSQYNYPTGNTMNDMSYLANGMGYASQYNITARAGGGQATATPLTAGTCWITTVATNGDSVQLPSAVGGQYITVINESGNNANIFSSNSTPSDTINGTAGTTAFSLVAGKVCNFASKPGGWRGLLSA